MASPTLACRIDKLSQITLSDGDLAGHVIANVTF